MFTDTIVGSGVSGVFVRDFSAGSSFDIGYTVPLTGGDGQLVVKLPGGEVRDTPSSSMTSIL